MSKRARTPIVEYPDAFAIELPGDHPPQERDRLTDQGIVVAYDRVPGPKHPSGQDPRWRLRALHFDREEWTRSGIRTWWAAHEVWFLGERQLDRPVPEICRSYQSPEPTLPTILICHRNTPLVAAREQINALANQSKSNRG
jgi:hypothetical protein